MPNLTLTILIVLVVAGVKAAAQLPALPPPPPCVPSAGEVQFVCGQDGPEDLVVVPGGQWVVAGAFGGNGGINLIRISDRMTIKAYPSASAKDVLDAKTYKSCPGAPEKARFTSHGLSLREGRNGIHTLYVVGHGARESVEVFTLDTRPETPTLTWIGCAVAPDPIGLNSVRWLDDGGFVATNFNPRGPGAGFEGLQRGATNGELWEWHTASGWQKVPGSDSSGANGIEISPDGRTLYVAGWGSQSFYRLSRSDKQPKRDEIKLGFRVDNIRWAADGSLLATGQAGEFPQGETVVVRIDPQTLKFGEVLRKAAIPGFSAGTVAVEVGRTLWIGSFVGDRIAIYPR